MKVLIVSDIHGNWPALQAVLAAEPDADHILCPGDLVDCRWPRKSSTRSAKCSARADGYRREVT